jgi:hypothetical protein
MIRSVFWNDRENRLRALLRLIGTSLLIVKRRFSSWWLR